MPRAFWALAGVGLGAGVAISLARWVNRTKKRYAPPNIAREAASSFGRLAERVQQAVAEGRAEMAAREAELRSELGLPRN